MNFAKLSPFIEEDWTILVKVDWNIRILITVQNNLFCWQQNIQLYKFSWRERIETI